MLSQLLFLLVLLTAGFFFARSVRRIRRNIGLGRPAQRTDHPKQRLRNMLRVALGQQKMVLRPVPGLLHLMVYVGFLVVNVEVLEIVVDGLAGTHRFFAPLLGGLYDAIIFTAELFLVLVLVGTLGFIARRDVAKLKRFSGTEMRRWPQLDARIILWTEITLVAALVVMNASDQVLQSRLHGAVLHGAYPISSAFVDLFTSMDTDGLYAVERTAWWLHILGIFAFLNYIPYSKHLHIFLAFPNTYFSNTGIQPLGAFAISEKVKKEVEIMLSGDPYAATATDTATAQPERFGAKDVMDLAWPDLLSAYTCTECGRCTSVCPANQTGKLLSPRKIMMDTRDRAEEAGNVMAAKGKWEDDGKSLLDAYITREELWACTTCNACAEACPVNINPVSIINQLRQYVVMEESKAPEQLNAMFNNLQNAGTPWPLSPSDRHNWAAAIQLKEKNT